MSVINIGIISTDEAVSSVNFVKLAELNLLSSIDVTKHINAKTQIRINMIGLMRANVSTQ